MGCLGLRYEQAAAGYNRLNERYAEVCTAPLEGHAYGFNTSFLHATRTHAYAPEVVLFTVHTRISQLLVVRSFIMHLLYGPVPLMRQLQPPAAALPPSQAQPAWSSPETPSVPMSATYLVPVVPPSAGQRGRSARRSASIAPAGVRPRALQPTRRMKRYESDILMHA